jgi:exosortase A-associated hydrolase 2
MTARKSFFFGENDHKLFAIHFQGTPQKPVAVLCQPYGDEAVKTRRVFLNIAKEWASKGIDVLLFDYFGTGNSLGEFEELRWSGMIEDIRNAIEKACSLTKKHNVIVAGLRLGATAAAIVAEIDKRIESLVLWHPIIEGLPYLQKALRSNIATQMAIHQKVNTNITQLINNIQKGMLVDINGFELTKNFFNEVSKVNLVNMTSHYKKKCTIVEIAPHPNAKISLEYKDLKNIYIKNGAHCDLYLAIEKNFWTDLKIYYQKASDMLNKTESALWI